MRMSARTSWLPMAGLTLVLVSMLAFLYVRTQGHDASSYFENVAMLRQLKQQDARWELDVLKAKMGIYTNYDLLAAPPFDWHQLQEKMQRGQQRTAGDTLANGSEAFRRAILGKTRLVEHFESHNSVLRNSLTFLPTAADDVQNAVSGVRGGDPLALKRVAAGVNKVLLDSMVYSQTPSGDKAAEIRSELVNVVAGRANLPVAVSETLGIFASHVAVVLREQPLVNDLLINIAAVPTAARIDDLDNLLGSEMREVEVQSQQYRHYLLLFAAALAGLLLYAAVNLVRSHGLIKRVNKDLQEVNATLEQRVQERTRELRAAQSELVTTARQAGMAEIATNVLHNVGNVLNSVNVSAGLVSSKVRDSKVHGLAKAVELMNAHAADLGDFLTRDEKGKLLPGYLNKLVVALSSEQRSVVEELGSLVKSIDHIKEIVATQQSYAGAASVVEAVDVRALLEDALRMNAAAMERQRVTVVKEFADIPLLQLDKPRLLQILMNLIGNARQAMESVVDRPHRMTLSVDIGDGHRLLIRLADNGEGIAPENLTRIFAHGFTTRKDGHGFGLHSCILAAQEMGGILSAHSDGPGLGATFTLELPLDGPKSA